MPPTIISVVDLLLWVFLPCITGPEPLQHTWQVVLDDFISFQEGSSSVIGTNKGFNKRILKYFYVYIEENNFCS